jgi:hypothetical protein
MLTEIHCSVHFPNEISFKKNTGNPKELYVAFSLDINQHLVQNLGRHKNTDVTTLCGESYFLHTCLLSLLWSQPDKLLVLCLNLQVN